MKSNFKYIPRGSPRGQSDEGLLGERDAALSPNRARGFIPRAKSNKLNFKRTDRIAQLMQRELAMLISQEIKDPRLPGLITISAAEVSKDLGHAKIYFTVFNGNPEEAETVLNAAASYLRSALAKTMTLRTVPQLHFIYDKSVEYGARLSRLIDQVNPPEDEQDV